MLGRCSHLGADGTQLGYYQNQKYVEVEWIPLVMPIARPGLDSTKTKYMYSSSGPRLYQSSLTSGLI